MALGINTASNAFSVSQTGVIWAQNAIPIWNVTGTIYANILLGRVVATGASTTTTISSIGATAITIAAVAAEFKAVHASADQQGGTTGSSVSPVSLSSNLTGSTSYQLSVAALVTRGNYTVSASSIFTSPTNSYSIANDGIHLAQANTIRNSAASDRATVLLVKVISAANNTNAIDPAGATISTNQWSSKHVTLQENQTGFISQ
jgi:hypothetical protein